MNYTIKEIAEMLRIKPASLRVALCTSQQEPYKSLRKIRHRLPGVRHALFPKEEVLAILAPQNQRSKHDAYSQAQT